MNTKDILSEKAFDTFKNLALEFNFNPPNKEEKDKFQQKPGMKLYIFYLLI
ncbi:DUF2972 domain-containing protein [Campylobacter coli]